MVGSGRLDVVLLLGFFNCFSVFVLSCDAEGLKRHRSWGVMWESLIWSFRCLFFYPEAELHIGLERPVEHVIPQSVNRTQSVHKPLSCLSKGALMYTE